MEKKKGIRCEERRKNIRELIENNGDFGVSGNTITYVDCNGNGCYDSYGNKIGYCIVKWDSTVTKSSKTIFKGLFSFSYVRVAP